MIYERARAYWIPHIIMELQEETEWVGGSMCGMWNTISEMEAHATPEEDEDAD